MDVSDYGPYAVVTFADAGTEAEKDDDMQITSEVPSCWLANDLTQCWWPNVKDVSSYILKSITPVIGSRRWNLYDVTFEGYFENLLKARKAAQDISDSSNDESQNCCDRTKRLSTMKKNPKYEDFVGSDYEQPTISSPPKLNKNESSKITENLSKARKAAQDISDSSNDESQNRCDRTKQLSAMKNNLKYEDFVGSDYEQPAISSPSKLNKNESSKITETLSNKTKFIEKQKPRVIDNVKTHISLPEMIILNPPTINDNQKKHLIESAPSTSYLHIQNVKNTEELNVINDRSDMILNMLISINQNVTKVLRALGTVTISVDAVSDRLQNIEQDGTQNYANHNEQFDTLNTFLPLQTKESAMEFDLLLDDAEIRKKLRKYLKNIGGNNAKESITRMLAKIFSVTFANSSSWCGQRGNFKVGDMKILSVIKETVRETYPNCTDKYFESEGREWFRQGTQKYMRMQKKSEKNAEILNPVDDVNNN